MRERGVHHIWIKICGITTVEHALVAAEAGADAIGLVFAPRSPRCISFDVAAGIIDALPASVEPIGLFADALLDDPVVRAWADHDCTQWIQLHGSEDVDTVRAMREVTGCRVMRGFRFTADAVRQWDACDAIDRLLVDGSSGGGGTAFDHDALAAMMDAIGKPVVLAGGLTPDKVAQAIATVRPIGVDVSSGVEATRGVKDAELIRAFCAAVQEAGR